MNKEDRTEIYKTAFKLIKEGHHLTDVAKDLGIKYVTLKKQVESNNIPYVKPKTRIPFKFHNEIKERYVNGESCTSLAKYFGFSNHSVTNFLKLSNIKIRPHSEDKFYKNGYSLLNRDAFSDINEEECAYFFGWLLSDGYLCKKEKYVTLDISNKDIIILEKLKNYLGSNNKILIRGYINKTNNKTYYSNKFTFSDKEIISRLIDFGLKNKKSLQEKCPDCFIYNSHFWRGFLDGDGSIYSGKSSVRVEIHGGKIICEQFLNFCNYLGIENISIYSHESKSSMIYRAVVSGKKKSKILLDELYNNCSIKLDRKYRIYEDRIINGLY